MYSNGDGVLKDAAEALDWYTFAAKNGSPRARVRLTEMYLCGDGVLKDTHEAAKWARTAAKGKGNDPDSLYYIASLYLRHEFGNYVHSYAWMNLAAAAGHSGAVKLRNALELKMTQKQINEAQSESRSLSKKI